MGRSAVEEKLIQIAGIAALEKDSKAIDLCLCINYMRIQVNMIAHVSEEEHTKRAISDANHELIGLLDII